MSDPADIQSIVDQDGAVLLDRQHGQMVTLNPTGGIVWRMITEGRTVAEVVQNLALRLGLSEAQVADDVKEFLGQLRELHLLPDVEPD